MLVSDVLNCVILNFFTNSILFRKGVMFYSTREEDIEKLEGEWRAGLLCGEIRAVLINTGWIEGYYK